MMPLTMANKIVRSIRAVSAIIVQCIVSLESCELRA